MTHPFRSSALAAALLCAVPVHASGDYGEPRDELVTRGASDFTRDEMLHGHVGIILPTWDGGSDYLAWRAIVTAGKAPHGLVAEGKAASDVPAGWVDVAKTSAADGASAPTFSAPGYDRPNCSADAQRFANVTLSRLQARPDVTLARVQDWVSAQQVVFGLCSRDPLEVLADPDPLVPPLPASEPLYWRQLRDYQMAAAAFYAAHYAQSQQAFARIGHTPGHPMQAWGAYLALRSHLREVQLPITPPPKDSASAPAMAAPEKVADLEALRREGAAILRDPALAEVHAAAAATLRRAAFLLAPRHRFAELTAMLDDLRADPSREDALDDWLLMGYRTGDEKTDVRTLAALREAHPWYDWVADVTHEDPTAAASAASTACGRACLYASQAWSRGLGTADRHPTDFSTGQHRAWLVAALMSDAPLVAPMEREALAVPVQAPEYASVRYWLAGRLAATGRADTAREIDDGLLTWLQATKPLAGSAINLVIQQRFGIATSVADASAWLLMSPVAATNPDTGERSDPAADVFTPSSQGMLWLDGSLSVADLLQVAHSLKTPSAWRSRVAVAAWMRADLLGDAPAALEAAALVEQWVPSLKPAALRYRLAPAGAERRHGLVVSALRHGMSPDPAASYRDMGGTWPLAKPDETVADLWCRIGEMGMADDIAGVPAAVPSKPQPPEVTADPARRDAERRAPSEDAVGHRLRGRARHRVGHRPSHGQGRAVAALRRHPVVARGLHGSRPQGDLAQGVATAAPALAAQPLDGTVAVLLLMLRCSIETPAPSCNRCHGTGRDMMRLRCVPSSVVYLDGMTPARPLAAHLTGWHATRNVLRRRTTSGDSPWTCSNPAASALP